MADGGTYLALLTVCLLLVLVSGAAVPDIEDQRDEADSPPIESNGLEDSILDQIAKVNQRSDQDLYEGDIVLTNNDSVKVDKSNTGDVDSKFEQNSKRNAMRNREGVWQNKVVPYVIDSQLKSVTAVIQSAFNEFHRQTCVKFIPKTNEKKWIQLVKQAGCWSFVGKTSGKGAQYVSIGNGCQYKGIIMHELLHAIGFWHEQSRPDRNQYIEILWENIQGGREHNFNKYSHGQIDTLKVPYDFQSLMHYGKYSFSANGKPTILSITNPSQSLGQRNGFTKNDAMEVNTLYDCAGPSNGWSSWSDYGPCDSNCKKSRQRFCTSSNFSRCPGANSKGIQNQEVACPAQGCKVPIDGHWGRWSSWSQCSTTCGQGNHTRTRRCSDPPPQNGGKPCSGVKIQSKGCKLRTCGLGPDDCEFEVGMCHWQQRNSGNQYKWLRRQGKTPSQDTGPDGDVTTKLNGQGYYIYAEASGISKGTKAELQSKTFPASSGRCLRFFYNMYGNDVGALNVYVMDAKTGTKNVVFSKSGNQGQKWYKVETDVTSPSDYKILFEAVCGNSYQSDVALDDIMFADGKCQGQTTPNPTTSQTSTASPSTPLPSTAARFTTTTALPTTARQTTGIPSTRGPSTSRSTTTKQTTMGPTTTLSSTAGPTTTPLTTAYPSATTVFTTRLPTTPGQGDDCNFDQNFCHWTNGSGTSRYPWRRQSFSTPSIGTGPSGDHTTGTGYYVYVETSNMSGANQTATLVSKVFPPFCIRCMRFYYHMYGSSMGTLNVYIRKIHINKQYKIFTKTGNQGNQWHSATVSFRSSYKYKIIFESVRGRSYTSDMAVDDISFTDGPCPTQRTTTASPSTTPSSTTSSTLAPTTAPTTAPRKESCNFDQGYCWWSKGGGSSKNTWTRRSGGTPSYKTGPSKDHTTGSGYYVYVETSSPAKPRQTATLVSKVFPPAPAGRCMSFYYHMYGATMGSLNVYVRRFNSYAKTKIFTKSGNQGNKWHRASVTIRTNYQYMIIFESVRGSSYTSDMAIDDVSLIDGPCPSRDVCNFDRNFCYWTNGGGTNKYPWKRHSFKTTSSGTGPSRDHTTGSGSYVYVETSSPAKPRQTATLVSKVFPPAPAGRCMGFYYHMYGANMGSLNVYVRRLNFYAKTKIFTKSGNQGDKWHAAKITIQTTYSYKVIFESVRGSSYTSDIAIDDISFIDAPCPATTPVESCNFDKSYCLWSKGGGSNHFSWTRRSGGTPSYKTGPSKDHTTGSGYYVYVETSSPAKPRQTATLVSKAFPPAPAGRCMNFYYHMYGATMGSLNVYIRRFNSYAKTKIFTKSGNQGNKWHRASVTIRTNYQYKIVFESVAGSSYESDIALDDITIRNGACP